MKTSFYLLTNIYKQKSITTFYHIYSLG